MTTSEWVGSCGVALLLLAFGLNLFGWFSNTSRYYQTLNLLGASLAGYASWQIDFLPFVLLEGTWALVALTALVRPAMSPSQS